LYAKLSANGYDVAKLSGATNAGVNDLQTIKDAQAAYDKAQPEGGFWVNLGAGMNNAYQGVKQLVGQGETDSQIEERRRIHAQMADSTTLGGLTQLGGEIIAGAPLGMGASSAIAKGLTMLPKVGGAIANLGGVGGRAVNLGGVGRGAVEGGVLGALNPVTEDESRGLNTLLGTVGGTLVPGALVGGNVLRKTLNKGNASNRAAKIFEDQLGPNNMHDISFRLDTHPAPSLPLSTASTTENATLAALERGARGRNTADLGYNQSRAVANKAWDTVKGATTQADDLTARVADREATIQLSKDHLDQFNDPTALAGASQLVSDTADALRRTTVARQNPEVTNLLSQTEQLLAHPERTAGDYASQYWRLSDVANGPNVSSEARGIILKMREAVKQAADEASNGPGAIFHSGSYKAGDPIDGVLYTSPNKNVASSYLDMYKDRFGKGGKTSALSTTANNPAPQDLVEKLAKKYGIDNEYNTPASVFDQSLHDKGAIDSLVKDLTKRGYDSTVLPDIPYGGGGKQFDAKILFPNAKTSKYVDTGGNQFTDMVERFKVDNAHVGAAQASKGVRESFVDPLGTPKTPQTFGGTPSITAAALRKSMVKNGTNAYGDALEQPTRDSLKSLEGELTRHEMSAPANSPGTSQLDIANPLNVVSSGRDNPFNYFPLVKGGANWLFGGARKATTQAADEAMMDPVVWQKMMAEYAASKSPLTPQEYMSRALRKSTMLPGDTLATQIGE
jgi:hypothetical protein